MTPPSSQPDRRARSTHVGDYFAIVRRRRGLFALVFLTVAAGIVTWTLLQTPVYEAKATLLVGAKGSNRTDLLGDLQALRGGATAATEIELIRSRSVARRAFHRLQPNDFVVEMGAYRPLDTLVASTFGRKPKCDVEIHTDPLGPGARPEIYVFAFKRRVGGKGANGLLQVTKRKPTRFFWESSQVGAIEIEFRNDVPFEAFGRSFTVRASGPYAGRRFRLTLRDPEDGSLWIQRRVRAQEVGHATGVVRLVFGAQTPRIARQVARAVAESYLDLKTEHKKAHAKIALEFVGRETERVRERLRESENELDDYRSQARAMMLSDRAVWLVERTAQIELERAETRLRREEIERLQARLANEKEKGFAAVLSTLGNRADPLTHALTQQLARLELERDRVVQNGTKANHPHRRRIEAEIAATNRRLQDALGSGLRESLARLDERSRHLGASMERLEKETSALPHAERKLAQHKRAVEADLRVYQFLVEKGQEAQIAHASALASARLIDSPLLPRARARPRLLFRLLLALALAIGTGILVTFLAEYLDRTIRDPAALEEATRLPLFVSIPAFQTVRSASARGVKGPLVAAERPESVLAEPYRALRTNLRFARMERPIKTIAITSAIPGEGKSVTSSNLAIACAQMGDRVLLIDADLRKSSTHVLFGNDRTPGLVDVLADHADWRTAMVQSRTEGLSLLHAGKRAKHPAALLDSTRFRELLAEVQEEFDWVIIDVPPILAVADASPFLPRLDAVLLLTRDRTCTQDVVADACGQLRRTGANLLGVLFNGFDAQRRQYGSYSSYGDYSDRGPEPTAPREGGRERREAPAG